MAGDREAVIRVSVKTDKARRDVKALAKDVKDTSAAASVETKVEVKTDGARKDVKALDGDVKGLDRSLDSVESSKVSVDTAKAKENVKGLNDEVVKTGKSGALASTGALTLAKSFGRAALAAGGIATGGMAVFQIARQIASATKTAAEWESALIKVAKTTGLSRFEVFALGDELLNLSTKLGISNMGLAQIAETAGQLGIQGSDNILAFTSTVAKLSNVTELTAEEAAEQVARIANAFNLPVTEAERLGSVLNELSNTTTAKAGDISDALTRIGSSGASIGLTVSEVAALSAVLIDAGIDSRRAGTQLRNIFIRLQTDAEKLGKVVGVTGSEFSSMVQDDALVALRTYLDALRKLPPELAAINIKDVFGDENFLAIQTLSLQTELLNKNLEVSNKAFADGTSLSREFGVTLDTVSKQWEIFQAHMKQIVIGIGNGMLPAIGDLLDSLNDLFGGFERAADEALRLQEALENPEALDNLIAKYEALATKTDKTEEESRQLRDVTDQLAARFPNLIQGYDDLGRVTGVWATAIKETVEQQRTLMRIQLEEKLQDIGSEFEDQAAKLQRLRKSQASIDKRIDKGEGHEVVFGVGTVKDQLAIVRDAVADTELEMSKLAQRLSGLFDPEAVTAQQLTTELDISTEAATRLVTAFRAIAAERKRALEAPVVVEEEDPDPTLTGDPASSVADIQREINAAKIAAMQEGLAKSLAAIELGIDTEIELAREKYAKEYPAQFAELERLLNEQREKLKAKLLADARPPIELDIIAISPSQIGSIEDLGDALLDLEDPIQMLDGSINGINEEIERLEKLFDAVTTDAARAEIRKLIDALKETRDEMEGVKKDSKISFSDIGRFASQAAGILSSAFANVHQARMNEIEAERESAVRALDDKLKKENLSERERTKLLEQRNQLEEQYRQREKEARADAARQEKLLALFQIAIQTAVSIVEASPNIFKMVMAGVLGAAQAAVVAATPIPKFAKGVTDFEGGPAIVGERGPELVTLPKGSNVITNENTNKIIRTSKEINARSDRPAIPRIDVKINADGPGLTQDRSSAFSLPVTSAGIPNAPTANSGAIERSLAITDKPQQPAAVFSDVRMVQQLQRIEEAIDEQTSRLERVERRFDFDSFDERHTRWESDQKRIGRK